MPSIRAEPELIRGRLRAQPHAFSPRPIAQARARDQGEVRQRPNRRGAPPQVLRGEWWLDSQAQFDAFFAWFETDLLAGALDFDVLVAPQGGTDPSYWTARFLSQPQYDVRHGLRWTVGCELLLLDEVGAVRTPPGMDAVGQIVFDGYAQAGETPARAEGAIVFGGYAIAVLPDLYASGSIVFDGYVISPEGVADLEDDELMRIWMGLDVEPSLIENTDALTAQAMGY